MKLSIVSDIHGNKPALKAVIDSINTHDIDAKVCCGDIVGYGPWPGDCIELVKNNFDYCLIGNHDRNLVTEELFETEGNRLARAGIKFSEKQVTESQKSWLRGLPAKEWVTDSLLAVHSHPEIEDKYVMPRNFPEMIPYLDEGDTMVLGHTHVQHKMHLNSRLVVNPGSVGQPRDKNPKAAYAIIDTEKQSCDFHRVSYPIDEVARKVVEVGLPEAIYERLYEGK